MAFNIGKTFVLELLTNVSPAISQVPDYLFPHFVGSPETFRFFFVSQGDLTESIIAAYEPSADSTKRWNPRKIPRALYVVLMLLTA